MITSGLKRSFYIAAGILIALVSACSDNECLENRNSLPLAGFYASTSNPAPVYLDSISIYGIGAPGDSILLDSASNITEAYLPFRIEESSTTYVIKYLQKDLSRLNIHDTITFTYDIIPFFVSSGCGAVYKYKVTDIRHSSFLIDSVSCPYGTIDNENIQNLRIFFRVKTMEEDAG